MTEIVIVAAARTPIGAFLGGLSSLPADQLGAEVIEDVLRRAKVDAGEVSDVVLGQVLTAGQGQNPARQAAIKAGLPKETPAITVNQVCGSGLRAVAMGYQAIKAGDAGIVLAGGQESMSLSTHCAYLRAGHKMGALEFVDTMIKDGLWDAFNGYHMGTTAENVAQQWQITREQQDLFAAESQRRAAEAQQAGRFRDEIVPVTVKTRKGDVVVDMDEHPKPSTTAESLAKLRAAFSKEGTITAGNASGLNDGASITVLILQTGAAKPAPVAAPTALAPRPAAAGKGDFDAEVLVLGAGPGGYSAAFRAADLGRQVVLVERWPTLGGVCLNVGCIPSKALLHAAKVIAEAEEMGHCGLKFAAPTVDIDALRGWKDGVVKKLTGGLTGLAKVRKVTVVQGTGRFTSLNQLEVEDGKGGRKTVSFEQAIIAAASEPVTLPFIPHADPRVIDSTGALELGGVPKRLLVVGGGIIGLEMATVYHALGARVTIVELMDQIIPGADKDLVTPLHKRIAKQYENIFLKAKVTKVEAKPEGLVVSFEGGSAPATDTFDRILVAVGRRPNGKLIGVENAGVIVDERGFIPVDRQLRTNVPHIFAIGDIVGQPMLAHKAVHEGKTAAEAASGQKSFFDAAVIPSVAYTDPEVAWVGLTENEAKAKGIKYGKGVFPWAASGRSLSLGRDEGSTKVLFDEATHGIIGCGTVGPNAGDLVAEAALAIEMGADASDIGLTIHAHPTLSETIGMAAEIYEGTITDLIAPKKKH